MNRVDRTRRRLLRYGIAGMAAIASGSLLTGCRNGNSLAQRIPPRELQPSSIDGLFLLPGFSARVIARSGEPVAVGSDYRWHPAPDGGATFATADGGWIYVSNCEMDDGNGGAGAVRFDTRGEILDAYPILTGTHRNCAGGPTPWSTWLSCEEVALGKVWECDPFGVQAPRALPALGAFMHEAVAVDPVNLQLYMTEDLPDGRFYRFTPARVIDGRPALTEGTLEVAQVHGSPEGLVSWRPIEDPSGQPVATRAQAANSTPFAGGEGAWYANRIIYFTTKRDNRVWAYDVDTGYLSLLYDDNLLSDPVLTGVDNVTVSQAGTVYVAEDGGNMQIVAIDPEQNVYPILQIVNHSASEITGPAFDPSGTRLYFSSQRGSTGLPSHGITYEITGPFA